LISHFPNRFFASSGLLSRQRVSFLKPAPNLRERFLSSARSLLLYADLAEPQLDHSQLGFFFSCFFQDPKFDPAAEIEGNQREI